MKWWQRIQYTWRLAFGLWLGMRLLLWALSAFLFYSGVVPLTSPFPEAPVALNQGLAGALFGSWLRWDGGFYYLILTQGYTATPTISAFWPLYPLLAKFFTLFGLHPLVALILVSNLALLVALVVFLEEVRDIFGKPNMVPAGLVLLTFPGAFFFYAPFPMSLALLLVLLSVRFARQHHWLAACLTGLLSGLGHSTVIPLSILLFANVYSDWKQSSGKLRWLSLLVPITPLVGVALFIVWRIRQGFPSLPELLGSSWGSSLLNPMAALGQLAQSIATGNGMSILKATIILVGLVVIFWLFHRKQFTLGIYQTGLLLYLVSFTVPDHPLGSFIRYFLLSFPVFLALGVWLRSRKWLSVFSYTTLGTINILLCGLYISWYFVA
jgi:hypothetical protein